MSLLDAFKPKWQNSNPDRRIEAIEEMGPSNQDTFERIALYDEDHRVRTAAVKRLTVISALAQISKNDKDAHVRRLAESHYFEEIVRKLKEFRAAASPEAYGMTAAPDFSGVTVSESKFTGKDAYNADLETKDLPYRYYGMNLTLLDQIRFSLYFETDGEAGEYYLTNGSFGSDDPINKEKITDDYTRIWITGPAQNCPPKNIPAVGATIVAAAQAVSRRLGYG